VAEETGIQATAGKRLDIEHYGTALGPKAVEFWAMHGQDGPFRPTAEVDRLALMSLAEPGGGFAIGATPTPSRLSAKRSMPHVPGMAWPGSRNSRTPTVPRSCVHPAL
jgi:hypothetical protein